MLTLFIDIFSLQIRCWFYIIEWTRTLLTRGELVGRYISNEACWAMHYFIHRLLTRLHSAQFEEKYIAFWKAFSWVYISKNNNTSHLSGWNFSRNSGPVQCCLCELSPLITAPPAQSYVVWAMVSDVVDIIVILEWTPCNFVFSYIS